MFMDYKIRNQLKTFTLMSICGGEKTKFMVDNYFQNAFNALSLSRTSLSLRTNPSNSHRHSKFAIGKQAESGN
jgi:hypothetical protein